MLIPHGKAPKQMKKASVGTAKSVLKRVRRTTSLCTIVKNAMLDCMYPASRKRIHFVVFFYLFHQGYISCKILWLGEKIASIDSKCQGIGLLSDETFFSSPNHNSNNIANKILVKINKCIKKCSYIIKSLFLVNFFIKLGPKKKNA